MPQKQYSVDVVKFLDWNPQVISIFYLIEIAC